MEYGDTVIVCPSVAHIIGPKLIKFMGLRSNYTVNIEMVDAETDHTSTMTVVQVEMLYI